MKLGRVGTSAGGWGFALSLAAVLAACGGGDAPAASGVSCGAGTVQKGTTCVPAGEGAGGSTSDDGPITCGPGTVLEGQECVAVDGGTGTDAVSCGPGTVLWDGQCVAAEQVPGAPIIAAFTATKLWGDAPLGTELTWSVLAPSGAALACELDGDGDGVFETSLPACPAAGSHSVTLTQPGKVEPRLRVTASGVTVEATEYLYVNKVDWAPGLVRVRSLPGLVSSVLDEADDTVVLSFEKAADASALDGAAVLWDEAPTGFVRKVTSATVKGATVTLATQAGTIFDIATGGFWARREPGASGPQPVGLPISNCEASQLGASYSPQTFGVPEISVVSGDDAVSFTEGKILIGMSVLEPVFDFGAGIFSALATLETRLCGDLTVSGSKDYTKEILVPGVAMGAALDFGLFKASAGFMPRVGFSISGAAQVAFTTVAGARSTLYVARRKDQAPEAKLIVGSQAQILDVMATAEAEAKLYLKPAIELIWGNPQKKCEQSKTKNNGSLKIGVEAELGVKASASVSMSSTGSELCAEAGWYGSAKAQFIPPLEILDCAEISAPLFDKPFYDQCWTLSGGTGGTGGMGGSGGSSGSTTTSTGSGGSSGSTTTSTGSGGAGGSSGSTTTSTGSGGVGGGGAGGSSGSTTTSTSTGGADDPPSCAGGATGQADCGPGGNESCCTSLLVPGGTVQLDWMQHLATMSDYRLDKYEISVGRFRTFVDAWVGGWRPSAGAGKHTHLNGGNGLSDGSDGYEPGWDTAWSSQLKATKVEWDTILSCQASYQTWTGAPGANEKRPINCASWYETAAFCIWDGGFLPSEAEWQYAAAGGSENRQYPWGDTAPGANADLAVYGCYWNGPGCSGVTNIAPVGSVPAGNGRWGHSDLAGNVWDWTLDWYKSPYPLAASTNYANVSAASNRVYRGGSFSNSDSSFLLAELRHNYAPTVHSHIIGARCARVP